MIPRRPLKAMLAACAVLVVAGAAAGFVQTDKRVEGAPSWFQVAEPRPGDSGSYATGIVVRFGDAAVYAGDDGRLHFQRHEDLWYPDGDRIRPLASYEAWWDDSGMFDAVIPWQTTYHDDDGTTMAQALPAGSWDAPADHPAGPVLAASDEVPDGLVVVPSRAPGFCGFRSSLQASPQDLVEPIRVQGLCPPPTEDAGLSAVRSRDGLALRVAGEDVVQGRTAVVFAWQEDPDALRLWFTEDTPYPVRMLVRLDVPSLDGSSAEWNAEWGESWEEGWGQTPQPLFPPGLQALYQLYELVEFQAGPAPASAPTPAGALPRAPWGQTGPDATGVDHPYPLAEAFADSAAEPGALADLLARSPDAYVARAESLESQEGDGETHTWWFTVTDGRDAVAVEAAKRPQTLAGLPSPLPLPLEPSREYSSTKTAATGLPRPDQIPVDFPTIPGVLDLWRFQTGGSGRDWAFSLRCADPDCAEVTTWIGAGTARTEQDGGVGDDGTVGAARHLVVDGGGRFLYLEEHPSGLALHGAPAPESGPFWEPGDDWQDSWDYMPLSAGFWRFPEDTAVVVGVGVFATLAGALYLLWPAAKSLPLLGLFSRTPRETLLQHPTRAQIHAILAAEPGLHFQELARRTGQGRGALEHHLNKLSKGGLISVQVSPGYTCYFPTGAVDRRVMAALPFLKAPGARRLLEAVVAEPGSDVGTLAQTAGVARSTASYHIQRLVDAGLLLSRRAGTSVLLTPTDLAVQALAA